MKIAEMDSHPDSPKTSSMIQSDLSNPESNGICTPLMVSKMGTSCLGLFDMSISSDPPPPYSLIPIPARTSILSPETPNSKTSSKTTIGIDIIAIHTLGGTPFGSWYRSRPSQMKPRAPANPSDIPLSTPSMWMRDILQPDFATTGARVLAYGYRTDSGTGAVKTTVLGNGRTMHVLNIDCIAKDLLCNIIEARARSQVGEFSGEGKQRPLIFLAHGFGGLVLKKAILLCNVASPGSERRGILDAMAHIVFLSTPHDAGDPRLQARWSDIVYASGVDASIPAGDWEVVTKEFQALKENEEIDFTVANIIETMGVVSAFGIAILTITTNDVARLEWGNGREKLFIAEGRNHLNIPDIGSPEDPVYVFIKDSIREAIDKMTLAEEH